MVVSEMNDVGHDVFFRVGTERFRYVEVVQFKF